MKVRDPALTRRCDARATAGQTETSVSSPPSRVPAATQYIEMLTLLRLIPAFPKLSTVHTDICRLLYLVATTSTSFTSFHFVFLISWSTHNTMLSVCVLCFMFFIFRFLLLPLTVRQTAQHPQKLVSLQFYFLHDN